MPNKINKCAIKHLFSTKLLESAFQNSVHEENLSIS